jgi:hypothetical protein
MRYVAGFLLALAIGAHAVATALVGRYHLTQGPSKSFSNARVAFLYRLDSWTGRTTYSLAVLGMDEDGRESRTWATDWQPLGQPFTAPDKR